MRAFGVFVRVLASGDDVPERARLVEVTGQLRSLEKSTSKGGAVSAMSDRDMYAGASEEAMSDTPLTLACDLDALSAEERARRWRLA